MDSPSALLFIVALAATLASYVVYREILSQDHQHPPGPRGLPLIGNLLDFARTQPWKTFAKWGESYGGIARVSVLGQNIIILNDPKHAIDLLDNKGSMYSDRPNFVMGGQLVGWEEGPALSPFCERWQEYRRLFMNFMGTKAKIDSFHDVLQEETNNFLQKLLETPSEWVEHSRRFAGGLVLQLAYGYRASEPGGAELVKLVDDAMFGFSETTKPNAFLVDVFPLLKHVPAWFPGAGWKHQAEEYRSYLEGMLQAPFELVKQQMSAGTARPSFTLSHLEGNTHPPQRERIIQWAAAGIYSGGADTTVAALEAFVLGITRHTTEQKVAQAELDAVIGQNRLPSLADRERLPYCEALYLEILRCYTIGPLGLPHVAREDDVHRGFFIPKGSVIITNNWRFYRDAKTYPDPEKFKPERFMGPANQLDPRKYLFGYGRRICPGLHLADASLWLACVSLLAAFSVSPPLEDGKFVVSSARFMDGGISHPEPFECTIKARSAGTEALIHRLVSDM